MAVLCRQKEGGSPETVQSHSHLYLLQRGLGHSRLCWLAPTSSLLSGELRALGIYFKARKS